MPEVGHKGNNRERKKGFSCNSSIDTHTCNKEEEQEAVTAQDDDYEAAKRKPPVQLTQSNSFLTRIKKTFAKKKSNPELSLLDEDTLIDQPQVLDVVKNEQDLLVPSNSSSISQNSSASTISTSSFEDNDEEDALEQRLIRQVTEMFSRSMFLYSNTCGLLLFYVTRYSNANMHIYQISQTAFKDPLIKVKRIQNIMILKSHCGKRWINDFGGMNTYPVILSLKR